MIKKNILINADDFGISHTVNKAVVYCFANNLINRTTLMVNMDFCDEAVELSIKNNFSQSVGLHLNLVEGTPLTDDIKQTAFCSANGRFSKEFFKNPRNRFYLSKKIKQSLKKEIEATAEPSSFKS